MGAPDRQAFPPPVDRSARAAVEPVDVTGPVPVEPAAGSDASAAKAEASTVQPRAATQAQLPEEQRSAEFRRDADSAAAPASPDAAPPAGASAPAPTAATRARAENLAAAAELSLPVVVPVPGSRVQWRVVGNRIERSDDEGLSWATQTSGVSLVAGDAVSAEVCWMVGPDGLVVRTVDGARWEQRPVPAGVDLVSVDARDGLHATVTASDGRRFSTEDGGRTWTPVPLQGF
jgi:hypothetical protein